MTSDTTTFFLAFLALFGGIAWYLLRLDRAARAIEDRLALLEAGRAPAGRPSSDAAANDKNDEREMRP